jgi:precorrin-6B methylase 2
VNATEAVELIAAAIPGRGGTWADLGAGDGTFTRALARLLGPNSRIYAVDRDLDSVESLRQPSGGSSTLQLRTAGPRRALFSRSASPAPSVT